MRGGDNVNILRASGTDGTDLLSFFNVECSLTNVYPSLTVFMLYVYKILFVQR